MRVLLDERLAIPHESIVPRARLGIRMTVHDRNVHVFGIAPAELRHDCLRASFANTATPNVIAIDHVPVHSGKRVYDDSE